LKNILNPDTISTTAIDPIIIFECNEVRRDTGLILLKRKSNDDDDENKFELHLHNDYTNQASKLYLNSIITMTWCNDAREYIHVIKH
jgi:hypothetical protein